MSRRLRGAGWGLVAASIWGGWMALTRAGVTGSLNAADLTALRFGVAAVLLAPVLWRRGLGDLGPGRACVLACGAGAPHALLGAGGLTFVPTAHAALTPATMPWFVALLAWLWLREDLDGRLIAGLLLAAIGVLCLAGPGLLDRTTGQWRGHALLVLAAASWALYSVGTRAWRVDPWRGAAVVAVLSGVLTVPIYAASGLWRSLLDASAGEVVLQATWHGLLTSVVALYAYNKAIALLGPTRAALFPILAPGIATLLAMAFLSEWPSALDVAGLLAVGCGLATTVRRPVEGA